MQGLPVIPSPQAIFSFELFCSDSLVSCLRVRLPFLPMRNRKNNGRCRFFFELRTSSVELLLVFFPLPSTWEIRAMSAKTPPNPKMAILDSLSPMLSSPFFSLDSKESRSDGDLPRRRGSQFGAPFLLWVFQIGGLSSPHVPCGGGPVGIWRNAFDEVELPPLAEEPPSM